MHEETFFVRNLGGLSIARCGITGPGTQGSRRNRTVHDAEESDNVILPWKPANNGARWPAEWVEGRTLTKGNLEESAAVWTQRQGAASSGLLRVRQRAREGMAEPFTALLHHVTPAVLEASYYALKRNAAPGTDGVTWEAYGLELKANLRHLHEQLHTGRYRPMPARRVYIDKPDGEKRPLSILCLEDKIAQQAIVHVLNAIYEDEFLGFSYGFRPGRSQHQALDALYTGIVKRKVNWVLDLDVQGFFDAVSHDWMLRMLAHRIADKRILRLISKWLKSGITDDSGQVHQSTCGLPQGAVVSPVLANVFLHYVFDLWSHHWRQKRAAGDAVIVRYADDIVAGFQHRRDAVRFRRELEDRLGRFGLKMHPRKTQLIEFGRWAVRDRRQRGQGKPETFDFLGFTHVCRYNWKGKFVLTRYTKRSSFRSALQSIKFGLRRRLHDPIGSTGAWLRRVVQGHLNYFAVPGNSKRLASFVYQVRCQWIRSLRRRSQRSRMPYSRYAVIAHTFLPVPRILHPFPIARFEALTQGRSPVR